jgi:hypothetical protein
MRIELHSYGTAKMNVKAREKAREKGRYTNNHFFLTAG